MPIRSQQHLGRDAQQLLCVRSPHWRESTGPHSQDELLANLQLDGLEIKEECTLSAVRPFSRNLLGSLPDEILFAIFEYVAFREPQQTGKEHIFPLTLTCRRWQRLAESLLYQDFDLSWKDSSLLGVLKIFLRRPDLATHVQSIREIQCVSRKQNLGGGPYHNTITLLSLCKTIRVLSLQMPVLQDALPVFVAIGGLSHLRDLTLSGYDSGICLEAIVAHGQMASLRRISLFGFGLADGSYPATPRKQPKPINERALCQFLPPERFSTSSICSMSLNGPCTAPEAVEWFLRWPKALTDLSIRSLLQSTYPNLWNTAAVEKIMHPHQQTLQRVELCMITGTPNSIPDFSQYSALETLAISAYDFFKDTPQSALRKLAAPSLRHLDLSFSTEDQHTESTDSFAAHQANWMKTFASHKSSAFPDSKLSSIHIDFNPDTYPYPRWQRVAKTAEGYDPPWPWIHLEEAARRLDEHGVKLMFEPSIRRQQWERSDPRSQIARMKNAARKARKAALREAAGSKGERLAAREARCLTAWLRGAALP